MGLGHPGGVMQTPSTCVPVLPGNGAGAHSTPLGHLGPSARLGVLVKTWPKLSETFILEELLGLQAMGRKVHLYALQAGADTVQHAEVGRLDAPVHVLSVQAWPAHLARIAVQCIRHPVRSLKGLALLVRRDGVSWRAVRDGLQLAQRMRQDGITHLHAHFISQPADVAQCAAQAAGMAFSISAHAKDIYLSAPAQVRRRLRAARFTVTCTQFNCDALHRFAPQARVQRMYHGVDASQFHPRQRPAEAHAHAGPPVILAVGRLVPKKGLDVLLHACALLRDAGQPLRCEIVGYGQEEHALRQNIQALRLEDHVHLLGRQPRDTVIACYARASVFVQPSRVCADGDRDGIPNVLLEAMAMGLPVVSTTVSGIPELVQDGRNGLLVPPDDAQALAAAVQRLLREPQLGVALGLCARATVCEQFDNPRNLRTLTRLLALGDPLDDHDRASPVPAVA